MAREATLTLSNGQIAQLKMPNLYALLAQAGHIPNPMIVSVIRLLEGTDALEDRGEYQKLAGLRDYYRGMYEVAALCLVSPVLRLDSEPAAGEIGPEDLAFRDLTDIYFSFFFSPPPDGHARLRRVESAGHGSEEPEGAAEFARDGAELPAASEQPAGAD